MDFMVVFIAGIFLSIMMSLNALLTGYLGLYGVSFVVHIIGVIILVSFIKLVKKKKINISGAPKFLYLVGILGVVLVSLTTISFNLVGATITIAASLFAQIVTSSLIDSFGGFGMKKIPFNSKRVGTFLIIGSGLFLMILK